MISCTFEGGAPAVKGLRHVTIGVIAVKNGKVLLVKRAAALAHNPNKFTVPGGFLDRNETTAQGALRELQEETGLTGEIICLFHVNDNPGRPKEDRQNVDFIYAATITSGKEKESNETSSVVWVDKNMLPEEEEFAFDHRATILKYFEFLEKPFPLPLVGKL